MIDQKNALIFLQGLDLTVNLDVIVSIYLRFVIN